MGMIEFLFGRPIASSEDEGQRITPAHGIAAFGLDALSSAAYGPEAALTILLPLGLAGVHYIIAVAITAMVERHWYHYFLHTQRVQMLTAMLLLDGDRRITIIDVPWYLQA